MKDLSSILDDYKNNGMNKETIKRALTEGKMMEEMVIFKSNLDKQDKKNIAAPTGSTSRPAFGKSQSLQTSVVTRPVSSSSKTSAADRKSPTINKLAMKSLKTLSSKLAARPSSKTKVSARKIECSNPQFADQNGQAQSEYMVTSSPLFPRKSPVKGENSKKVAEMTVTPLPKRMESASVKNIATASPKKESQAVSSYSHLFRQTRYNTPSVSSKTFGSGNLQRLSEPPASVKTSSRKRIVEPNYNSLVGAFGKKKAKGTTKLADDKKSTVSSIRTGSNFPTEERRSYGSKRSGFDNEVPQKQKFKPEFIQKDLLETNLLIDKLKSVTENRLLNLGRVVSFTSTQPSHKEGEGNPPSSSRTRDPVMPTSDFVLEKMYRDLIKRTNTLYKEIYTD
jgi:hypothetical protein